MPYWRLFYHITWAVKERRPLIEPAFAARLHAAIAAKASDLGGQVFAVGGVADHIHLAVSIPPTLAPAKFIGQVKGSSSHFVNHVIQPGYYFAWQAEYGIVTFGERQLKTITAYIHNQERHHGKQSLVIGWEYLGEPPGDPSAGW
jgi:putative transposase